MQLGGGRETRSLTHARFDVFAEQGNLHSFGGVYSAGERVGFTLILSVCVTNCAMGAVAIPTEIPVRDSFVIQKLQSTQQAVVLWHLDGVAAQFDVYQPVKGLKNVVINLEFLCLHIPIIGMCELKVYGCKY
jgi:hypothetical protein